MKIKSSLMLGNLLEEETKKWKNPWIKLKLKNNKKYDRKQFTEYIIYFFQEREESLVIWENLQQQPFWL